MSWFNPLPVLIVILFLAVYVAPAVIAYKRRTTNRRLVAILSLLLGWMIIPWVVTFVLAMVWDQEDLP